MVSWLGSLQIDVEKAPAIAVEMVSVRMDETETENAEIAILSPCRSMVWVSVRSFAMTVLLSLYPDVLV